MKKKLIFATGNEGKMKEIREILGDLDYEILSMKEAGVDVDIVEDGTTFEENAIIKAKTVMEATGSIVLADDSGLEIDYLNKEPGVYSARYMGENTSYRIKNQIILDRLHGVPDIVRSARFVCVIAAAFPDGTIETRRATIEGRIAQEPAGEMVLVMILFSIFRTEAKQLLSFQQKKRMKSVIVERLYAR